MPVADQPDEPPPTTLVTAAGIQPLQEFEVLMRGGPAHGSYRLRAFTTASCPPVSSFRSTASSTGIGVIPGTPTIRPALSARQRYSRRARD